MKIFLVGGSGMIGSRILNECLQRGHDVVAACRQPERIAEKLATPVTTTAIDATDPDALTKACAGFDVLIMSISPRTSGNAIEEARQFAHAAISAAEANRLRLMFVGGAGSLKQRDGSRLAETIPEPYRQEALAMCEVRDMLASSTVDWLLFSPAHKIFPGEKTGHYRLGTTSLIYNDEGESKISVDDYADAFVNELEIPRHRKAQMTIGC